MKKIFIYQQEHLDNKKNQNGDSIKAKNIFDKF
jgi:hypothetical protein